MKNRFLFWSYGLIIIAILIGLFSQYYFGASVISGVGALLALTAMFIKKHA